MEWYVMKTVPGKEQEAAQLLERTVERDIWQYCRILKKQKIFLCRGKKLLQTETMFPGYVFVKTSDPKRLQKELEKSRELPKLLSSGDQVIEHLEQKDLQFLQSVCGEELEREMGLSTVLVDGEGNIRETDGILAPYRNDITRKRLRKRYVVTEIDLFNRKQEVLFGIRLDGDVLCRETVSASEN